MHCYALLYYSLSLGFTWFTNCGYHQHLIFIPFYSKHFCDFDPFRSQKMESLLQAMVAVQHLAKYFSELERNETSTKSAFMNFLQVISLIRVGEGACILPSKSDKRHVFRPFPVLIGPNLNYSLKHGLTQLYSMF